eukprot:1143435-Pelagomonas_calceolata.AAC.2
MAPTDRGHLYLHPGHNDSIRGPPPCKLAPTMEPPPWQVGPHHVTYDTFVRQPCLALSRPSKG